MPGITWGVGLGVGQRNGDQLLLDVNAVCPLVPCDLLQSPRHLISLTFGREGEGKRLAGGTFMILFDELNHTMAGGAAADVGQRGHLPLSLSQVQHWGESWGQEMTK